MKFKCKPVEIDFLERAPHRIETSAEIAIPREELFALLGDEAEWPRWFEEMQEVTWTTPPPRGEGTTRTVQLTTMKAWEHFVLWEEDARFAFRFDFANRPLFSAFMEDYRFTQIDANTCHFTWIAAFEPTLATRLAAPIIKGKLEDMFTRAIQDLKQYAEGR